MIHSLVHIESVAIDLSWDVLCRFNSQHPDLPREFYDDWLKVAADECRHYRMLKHRLKDLGAAYGDLPAHDGLWESAMQTSSSLLARLAIEHMVHEARGLDVTPNTIDKFASNGDHKSAVMLRAILQDEITHVAAGRKWFTYLVDMKKRQQQYLASAASAPMPTTPSTDQEFAEMDAAAPAPAVFANLVSRYFRGSLKPPFNKAARDQAGLTEEWYLSLVAAPKQTPTATATATSPQSN
jgi:uncharacterized ferritin-like protein (DUF455 family)